MSAVGRAPWVAPAGSDQGNELLWILTALRQRWGLVVLVTLLLAGLATGAILSIIPFYSATTTVLIDPAQAEYTDLGSSPGARQGMIWPAEMETYVKVLWSDDVAEAVVRAVGPEAFRPQSRFRVHPPGWLVDALAHLRAAALAYVGRYAEDIDSLALAAPEGEPSGDDAAAELRAAVDSFQRHLKVERDSLAAALLVTYRAADPALAATVANAAARAFLDELVRVRRETLVATTNYLRERVQALQSELEAVEGRAQTAQNQLSGPEGSAVARVRLGELIAALSIAEAELTGLRADLAAVTEARNGLGDRLASSALQDLRRERVALEQEIALLRASLSERHPQLAERLAQRARIDSAIREEERAIRAQIERALRVGEERVAWLNQELDQTAGQVALGLQQEVQLKQLTTGSESIREIYQDILARYQRASEQQLIVQPAARILNRAIPPDSPDRRKSYLALVAALAGSLAAAMGLAVLLELRQRGFRSADELAIAAGLPVVGSLPLVARDRRGQLRLPTDRSWRRQVYLEAVARLALRVHAPPSSTGSTDKVVLVSSALPAEGKSVVCLALARQLTSNGHKVLLIDADLHKKTLQRLVDLPDDNVVGLSTMLTSPELPFAAALIPDTRTGLDLMPAATSVEDPAKLLSSPRMAEIVAVARKRYDAVIIDTPPVLSVSDASTILHLVDQVLIVVRWQSTPRRAVDLAIQEVCAFAECRLGLILNMIDLRRYLRTGLLDRLSYYRFSAAYRRG